MHQLKRFPQAWTKDLFDNLTLWCMGDDIDEEWGLGKKLTEKAGCVLNPHDIEGEPAYAECVAVYCCRQARGPSVGKEAIVKVRIQIPPERSPSSNPQVRRMVAQREPCPWTQKEVWTLEWFNKRGCAVTPKVLHIKYSRQEWEHMPVPDGYVAFIIMEKVPGVPLDDFWTYPREKRDKIRAAFRKSLTEFYRHHAHPIDKHLGNIIYDEKADKCWFVDYEHIEVAEDERPLVFNSTAYFSWDLAKRDEDRNEIW